MDTTLVPAVKECERVIHEAIKYFGLSVDPQSILVTIQTKGRKSALGWFWGNGWGAKKEEGEDSKKISELNLCAEYLSTNDIGETLLHELAHAENHSQGIKDYNSNQRHNKKFKLMAEKLGLVVNDKPDKRYGFGFTKRGEGAEKFLQYVRVDEKVFSIFRKNILKPSKKGSRLRKYVCPNCEQIIRAAKDELNIICGDCQEKFEQV